ncbi:MAG: glycosyltransferase family 4 protein [Acidobacteria bacterium]|nr:glycosyltransferase family 4 protein [Acidobacteriota bacterium]
MRTVAYLLHTASLHQISGGERSLVEMAAAAAREGLRCLVVAPCAGRSTALARAAGLEVEVRRCRMLWFSHPGRMSAPGAAARLVVFLAGWPGWLRLRRLLRRRGVDLVHVNGIVHVWGAAAARSLGLPVVWHVREIVGGRLRRRLLVALVQALADRILAVSSAVAAQFSGAGERVRILYNGIPPGPEGPGVPAPGGKVRVGHAGQILLHKGQEEFLQVARRLIRRGTPGVEFRIAGAAPDGRGIERLRRQVKTWGLEPHVDCTGFLPDLRAFLVSLDVLAVTSTAPDPLPRVVAEAMMEGVPTVAFATGGIPEMVRPGETGILVPPGDLDGFVEALERLVRNPGLRRRMGEAARTRAVELFSMGSYIRHCVGVYDEIWSSGARTEPE